MLFDVSGFRMPAKSLNGRRRRMVRRMMVSENVSPGSLRALSRAYASWLRAMVFLLFVNQTPIGVTEVDGILRTSIL